MSVVPFIPADARRLYARLDAVSANRDAVVAAVVSSKSVYGEGQVTKWVDAILRVRPDIAGLSTFAGAARAPAQHPQLRTRNVVAFPRPEAATEQASGGTATASEPAVRQGPSTPPTYDQNRAVLKTDARLQYEPLRALAQAATLELPGSNQLAEMGHRADKLGAILQSMVDRADGKNAPLGAIKTAADALVRQSASPDNAVRVIVKATRAIEAYEALRAGFDIRPE